MLITNISEANAQLSALIEKALSGQKVIIGKAGKRVAKLYGTNEAINSAFQALCGGK